MSYTRLMLLAGVASLALQASAHAGMVVPDPAPSLRGAAAGHSTLRLVAWKLLNGKWINDAASVAEDAGNALRRVDPAAAAPPPQALGGPIAAPLGKNALPVFGDAPPPTGLQAYKATGAAPTVGANSSGSLTGAGKLYDDVDAANPIINRAGPGSPYQNITVGHYRNLNGGAGFDAATPINKRAGPGYGNLNAAPGNPYDDIDAANPIINRAGPGSPYQDITVGHYRNLNGGAGFDAATPINKRAGPGYGNLNAAPGNPYDDVDAAAGAANGGPYHNLSLIPKLGGNLGEDAGAAGRTGTGVVDNNPFRADGRRIGQYDAFVRRDPNEKTNYLSMDDLASGYQKALFIKLADEPAAKPSVLKKLLSSKGRKAIIAAGTLFAAGGAAGASYYLGYQAGSNSAGTSNGQ